MQSSKTQIAGFVYFATEGQLRLTAHKIADVIYEKLTGDAGVFATRITYVVKRGRNYELHVADADGYGAQSVLSSNEPIISPAWPLQLSVHDLGNNTRTDGTAAFAKSQSADPLPSQSG